jgi:hypothetical protein
LPLFIFSLISWMVFAMESSSIVNIHLLAP